jgi:hypothetical protein
MKIMDKSQFETCSKFIAEFGEDVIAKYRVLDPLAIKYELAIIATMPYEVKLRADISTNFGERTVQVEDLPVIFHTNLCFYPDFMTNHIQNLLDIPEDESKTRLEKAGLFFWR